MEYQFKAVARDVHVTPKSDEVQMKPPLSVAAWYCPVLDNDTEYQFKLVARDVHVTP